MGLFCYRSMVFSDMPLGMHETFMHLRHDHPMIRKVSGLVVLRSEACWGYSGSETLGKGKLEGGESGVQAVVDRVTSRGMRLEHPEYLLDDDTHCLLVTTTDSSPSTVARLVALMERTMPEKTRCDWLHIEWGPGVGFHEMQAIVAPWNQGDFDRNCIRNRTASEKVEYGHHEWSAAIIQYLESRMLEKQGAVDLLPKQRQPRTFGFATLDFSQMEGRRFLEAKAFLDVVEREDQRVDLDKVYQRCSEALRGGKLTYRRAKEEAGGPPDLDGYASVDSDYQSFDVREKLGAFRRDIMLQGGTIERVERKVEELIAELKTQVDHALAASSQTAQERLSVIRAMLGEVSEYTQGKPLRPTLMLDDCEAECLVDLAELSGDSEEVPSVQTLHMQRRLSEELMDDIVNLNRGIDIDKEAGQDTSEDEELLRAKREEHAKWVSGYADLRKRYTRHRRSMFAGMSSQWMDGLFERLVGESTYVYTPPVREEKPLLSAKEKRAIAATLGPLLMWLPLSWMMSVTFWLEQVVVTAVYVLVWLVVLSLRLRRPKVVHENPMVRQREMWHAAAQKLFNATVVFATVNRFQKKFDQDIRKPLLIEYNRLTEVLAELRVQAAEAQETVDTSFTKVDFVQHIGDADSFNLFYEKKLATSMIGAPSIVEVYLAFKEAERRDWTVTEAMDVYKANLREVVDKDLEDSFSSFGLLAFLLNGDREHPPLFVKAGLGSLSELIRKAAINLESLHDFAKDGGDIYVFQGQKEDGKLMDMFKEEIQRMFPEASSNNLHFVNTDDPNRIGFLRSTELDEKAIATREKESRPTLGAEPQSPSDKKGSPDDGSSVSPEVKESLLRNRWKEQN